MLILLNVVDIARHELGRRIPSHQSIRFLFWQPVSESSIRSLGSLQAIRPCGPGKLGRVGDSTRQVDGSFTLRL
jgi:hypothetical protein